MPKITNRPVLTIVSLCCRQLRTPATGPDQRQRSIPRRRVQKSGGRECVAAHPEQPVHPETDRGRVLPSQPATGRRFRLWFKPVEPEQQQGGHATHAARHAAVVVVAPAGTVAGQSGGGYAPVDRRGTATAPGDAQEERARPSCTSGGARTRLFAGHGRGHVPRQAAQQQRRGRDAGGQQPIRSRLHGASQAQHQPVSKQSHRQRARQNREIVRSSNVKRRRTVSRGIGLKFRLSPSFSRRCSSKRKRSFSFFK